MNPLDPNKSYTMAELQSMGAKPIASTPAPTAGSSAIDPNRSYSLQELQSMGAQTPEGTQLGDNGLPNVTVGKKEVTPKNVYDQQRYEELSKRYSQMQNAGEGQNLTDQYLSQSFFGKDKNNYAQNMAKGVVKKGLQIGDTIITGINALTGNNLIDDPAFQFGTASRKLKNEELFKGKGGWQKFGATVADAAKIVVTEGIQGMFAAPIAGVKAVQAARFTGNAGSRIAAKLLPEAVGNVAQGIVLSALGGQDITAGNVTLDAISAGLPGALSKITQVMGFKGGLGRMAQEEADKVVQFAKQNPEQLGKLIGIADKKVDEAATAITKLRQTKQIMREMDDYQEMISSPEFKKAFKGNEDAIATSIAKKGIEANNNFLDESIIKSGYIDTRSTDNALTKLYQSHYDEFRNVTDAMSSLPAAKPGVGIQTNAIIKDATSSIEKAATLQDINEIGTIIRAKIGDQPDMRLLTNLALESQANISKNSLVAGAVQRAARKKLFEIARTVSPKAEDMLSNMLWDIRLTAASKKFYQSIDNQTAQIGGLFGRKLSSQVAAILATGGNFLPFNYIVGHAIGENVYDAATGAYTKSKIQNGTMFKAKRGLDKLAGRTNINDVNPRKAMELKYTDIKGAKKAAGQQEAVRLATKEFKKKELLRSKTQLSDDKSLDKMISSIESERSGTPMPPKEIIQEAKQVLDSEIDTAKEVAREIKRQAKLSGKTENEVLMDSYKQLAVYKKELSEALSVVDKKDTTGAGKEMKEALATIEKQIQILSKYSALPELKAKKQLFKK